MSFGATGLWAWVLCFALGAFVGSVVGGLFAYARSGPSYAARTAALRAEAAYAREELARERARVDDDLRRSIESAADGALRVAADALVAKAAEQFDAQRRIATGEVTRVVTPLGAEIGALKATITELDRARVAGEAATKAAVEQLATGSAEVRSALDAQRAETSRLVGALKDSRQRGRWGEITLRNIVEKVGMTEHADFCEQTKLSGIPGRPDVVISLPTGAVVPIDAKAPLDSYYASTEATTAEEQQEKLLANARALRARVREVAQRGYASAEIGVGLAVLFVPLESVLVAALSVDPQLLEDALDEGVLLASPVTLMAYLRGFAHSWAMYKQTVNAGALVAKAKTLVERLDVWHARLADVGHAIEKTAKKWNEAASSFDSRLAVTAREMRELGDFALEPQALPMVSHTTRSITSVTSDGNIAAPEADRATAQRETAMGRTG